MTTEPLWIGTFTDQDRAEINALRAAQAQCVATGNVPGYARLCTEDVVSMLTGYDLVAGQAAFVAFQTRLFAGVSFPGMRKQPFRVERGGDLAVEIGWQEIAAKSGAFGTLQKYTHVMRKTPAGWRFCVLMSNNSAAS